MPPIEVVMDTIQKILVEYFKANENVDFSDNKRIKALLTDLIPQNKLERNVLVIALEEGICERIEHSGENIGASCYPIIKVLCEDYGIIDSRASWAVETWRYILGKNSDLSDSLTLVQNETNTKENEDDSESGPSFVYEVTGEQATDLRQLQLLLIKHPEECKKELVSGKLAELFREDEELMDLCTEVIFDIYNGNDDRESYNRFVSAVYKEKTFALIDGESFIDAYALGQKIDSAVSSHLNEREGEETFYEAVTEMLQNDLFHDAVAPIVDKESESKIKRIEEKYRIAKSGYEFSDNLNDAYIYEIAYVLMKSGCNIPEIGYCKSVYEMMRKLNDILDDSVPEFERIYESFYKYRVNLRRIYAAFHYWGIMNIPSYFSTYGDSLQKQMNEAFDNIPKSYPHEKVKRRVIKITEEKQTLKTKNILVVDYTDDISEPFLFCPIHGKLMKTVYLSNTYTNVGTRLEKFVLKKCSSCDEYAVNRHMPKPESKLSLNMISKESGYKDYKKILCKECKRVFVISGYHRDALKKISMEIPCRCPECDQKYFDYKRKFPIVIEEARSKSN